MRLNVTISCPGERQISFLCFRMRNTLPAGNLETGRYKNRESKRGRGFSSARAERGASGLV